MKIIGIVAADNNWAIGKNNGLLYKLPLDMKKFKETTTGHFVVCGYNTLLSFPRSKPLPNRVTFCLASNDIERNDCIIAHTFADLLRAMKTNDGDAIFYVIGGAMMYKTFLPYYDEVFVTKVDAIDPEATVFFPNLDKDPSFYIKDKSPIVIDNGYKTVYVTYARKK